MATFARSMNWETLYSAQRSGDRPEKANNPDSARTSYIRDYDRIIFSSAFRRLQNKTQVFPLPGAVFVHNRLTHSLEVASVGRSLGKAIGDHIAAAYFSEQDPSTNFYQHELQSVVAAACLAHDIGNPPFGHSGEDSIRSFFRELEGKEAQQLKDHLSPEQLADFEHFEGNANALRILSHSYNESVPGGYKLTFSTLASIVKYPCSSREGFNKRSEKIATKKSGFFMSEFSTYQSIAQTLGIPKLEGFDRVYARHPFVFLVEAADDVCYRVIDLEDAHRLGILSLQKFQELFLPFFEDEKDWNSLSQVASKLKQIIDDNQKVQYIRARWIGLMIGKLTQCFIQHEEAILNGTMERALLEALSDKDLERLKDINTYSINHVYRYKAVLEIEVAGYHVIGGLLKAFLSAALTPDSGRARQLLQLIPVQYPLSGSDLYPRIQSIVDFISGMTDLYALDLYRKITGISIPELR